MVHADDGVLYPFVWALGAGAFVVYGLLLVAVFSLGFVKFNAVYKVPLLINLGLLELFLGYVVTACIAWRPYHKTSDDTILLGLAISAAPVGFCALLGYRAGRARASSAPPPSMAPAALPVEVPHAKPVAPPPAALPAGAPVADVSSAPLIAPPHVLRARKLEEAASSASPLSRVLTGILVFVAIPLGCVALSQGWFLPVAGCVGLIVVWKSVPRERKARIVQNPTFVPGITGLSAFLGVLIAYWQSPWLNSENQIRDLAIYTGVGALAGAFLGFALGVFLAWEGIAQDKKERVVTNRAFIPVLMGITAVLGAMVALHEMAWRNVVAEDRVWTFFLFSAFGGVPGVVVGAAFGFGTRSVIVGPTVVRPPVR